MELQGALYVFWLLHTIFQATERQQFDTKDSDISS